MKKIVFFFLLTAGLWMALPTVQAASLISIGSNTNSEATTAANEQSLFQTIGSYQNAQQILLGLNIELRQEQEKQFTQEEKEIEKLRQQLKDINSQILEAEASGDTEKAQAKKDQREKIRYDLESKSQEYSQLYDLHLEKIKNIEKNIDETKAELEKLLELGKNQAWGLAMRIGFFMGLIFLLLILRFIIGKMINRLSGRIPIPRSRALHRMNVVIFNIIIAIMIIAAMFSQVLNILPILAILGTAFAFALRNVIASFIAWFVIGTDQGYKVGDLIEAQIGGGGSFRGRVLEVHPLITVLRQTGLRGDTGQIISFPNKIIFEDRIRNFSKMYRFTYIMIEFLLEDISDVGKAQKLLIASINESIPRDIEEATKNLPNLQTKFGITEEQIAPQVFIEPDPKGIMLRGKYLCRLDSRHSSRTKITRHFLEKIKGNPDIKLRFVQFGDYE